MSVKATLILALFAVPLAAESPSFVEPRLSAAAWCAVADSDDADSPGCDAGVAVSLHRFTSPRKLAWVAVVGTETAGTGLAWIAHEGEPGRPTIAVSVGVVARWTDAGIDPDSVAPAVGATFGWGGE